MPRQPANAPPNPRSYDFMKAVIIEHGELRLADRPRPELPERGILVRVHATAVNRADLLQVQGRYPAPAGAPEDIPGLEYAGVVAEVGPGATRWRAGDRVLGLVGGGAYAEYVAVHEDEAVRVPDALGLDLAAALPEAFITAHDALRTQARLARGETLLVHAAGSGVGTAALQLAHALGARVLGTVRTAAKAERLGALGADVALQADESWPERVLAATAGRGVDVVLDLAGGGYLAGNVRVLAPRGRLMIVGLVAGRSAELDMGEVLRKRLRITGTAMRSRALDEKIAAAAAFAAEVLPLLERGAVRPVVHAALPAERAAEAHRMLAANETFGKVVLRWEGA